MIDPADEGATLPLPVTAPCPHILKFSSASGTATFKVLLTQDLLGDWFVLQSWGQKKRAVASADEGVAMLSAIAKRLIKDGHIPDDLAVSAS
jgi:hypothetical protein